MVCHTDKSPLVEVLGISLAMHLWENLHEKYQVIRYITGMHIDTG